MGFKARGLTNFQKKQIKDVLLKYAGDEEAGLHPHLVKYVDFYIDKFGDKMRVSNLEETIVELIKAEKGSLEMGDWHTCKTTHCLAGWAEALVNKKAREEFVKFLFEDDLDEYDEEIIGDEDEYYTPYSSNFAESVGAFVYAVSRPGKTIPNFFEMNDAFAWTDLCHRVGCKP